MGLQKEEKGSAENITTILPVLFNQKGFLSL